MNTAPRIAGRAEVLDDAHALAQCAADVIAAAVAKGPIPFRMALAGGSTPQGLYRLLADRTDIAWSCVEIFFGDERFVPPDDPASNYGMLRETLLAGGKVQPRKLFAVPTDGSAESAAARYEDTLRQQYGASTLEPGAPLFDLQLLGLGEDGHTASLLPGQPVLEERSHWVAPVPHGRDNVRLTLTYPALESSRLTLFLVSGSAKARAVRRVRGGDTKLPAGRLCPEGAVLWLMDRDAAGG